MANSTYFFDPNQTGVSINPNSNESMMKLKQNPTDISMSEFDDGEFCKVHRGEPLIAIDDTDPDKYGCNKCVFERLLQRPRFLAHQAKMTKKRVDKCYEELTSNLQEVDKLEPSVFQQTVQKTITDYFQTIYRQIRDIEKEVHSQIKSSNSLEALRDALEALHEKLNHKQMDQLQEEKKTIDNRIETQRFANIVRHK